MKVKLAAGLLVLASTITGVAQASPNVRGSHNVRSSQVVVKEAHAPRRVQIERAEAVKPASRASCNGPDSAPRRAS